MACCVTEDGPMKSVDRGILYMALARCATDQARQQMLLMLLLNLSATPFALNAMLQLYVEQ